MMGAVDASDVILACAYLNTPPPSEDGVWPPVPSLWRCMNEDLRKDAIHRAHVFAEETARAEMWGMT